MFCVGGTKRLKGFWCPVRWEVEAQPRLLSDPALAAQPVDLLILDNTYCHPKYAAQIRAHLALVMPMSLLRMPFLRSR